MVYRAELLTQKLWEFHKSFIHLPQISKGCHLSVAEIIPKEPGQVMLPRDTRRMRNVCTPENAKTPVGNFRIFFI